MLKNNLKFKKKKKARMKKTVYSTCFQNSMHHGAQCPGFVKPWTITSI